MNVPWRRFKADAKNLPAERPGAYRIVHIETERSYIGISRNIAKRLKTHSTKNTGTKIAAAIERYGCESFLIEPLFYLFSRDDLQWLSTLEVELIREYEAIENGFNICESSPPFSGAYGEEFRRRCKIAQNKPGVAERRAATMAKPEVRARWDESMARAVPKISESLRAYFSDPIAREKNIITQREAQSRPDVVAKKSASIKAKHRDPEYRAKYEAYFNDKEKQEIRLANVMAAMQRPNIKQQRRVSALARTKPGVKGFIPKAKLTSDSDT